MFACRGFRLCSRFGVEWKCRHRVRDAIAGTGGLEKRHLAGREMLIAAEVCRVVLCAQAREDLEGDELLGLFSILIT